MTTNWKAVALDAHQKEHAKQTASLQQQLDHALAQIERLEKSKRAKGTKKPPGGGWVTLVSSLMNLGSAVQV